MHARALIMLLGKVCCAQVLIVNTHIKNLLTIKTITPIKTRKKVREAICWHTKQALKGFNFGRKVA
jgi:hypothetical protein